MSTEPAGFLFLHEVRTLMQWLALAAIITASAGITLSTRAPRLE